MQIEVRDIGARSILLLTGRLDVTWAEHVLECAQELIRRGRHQLRVDAAGVDYISSAGIRTLIRIQKELQAVNGQLLVVHPTPFVASTLSMSGLGHLLGEPQELSAVGAASSSGSLVEVYPVVAGATMHVQVAAGWRPWDMVQDADIRKVVFASNRIGLGIGSQGVDVADARERLGEFLAVPGALTWMPSGGNRIPDYALQTEKLVPDIFALQALVAEGGFSHLLRFQPVASGDVMALSHLMTQALEVTGADAVAMVCVAEIDGLVGVSLARSPGLLAATDVPGCFPDVREWMTYCGERVHARQSALLVSFVARESAPEAAPFLAALPTLPGVRAHTHVAVLPFRPLQAGELDLKQTVHRFFTLAEPLDLLHLITDDRPLMGLGESAFIRGACWCAALEWERESA
jgi:anti-anti-sigma factor